MEARDRAPMQSLCLRTDATASDDDADACDLRSRPGGGARRAAGMIDP